MQKRGIVKRDNKVLIIGLLVVFLIALVVLNFGRFTGSATKEGVKTVIRVDPETIKSGEYINIDLIPGSQGNYNEYAVCNSYNDVCLARPRFSCSSFKCLKPVTEVYKSWSEWQGIYYIKVFDYGSKGYVRAYFTVE